MTILMRHWLYVMTVYHKWHDPVLPLFSQAAASYWQFSAAADRINDVGFEPCHKCLFNRWCPVVALNHSATFRPTSPPTTQHKSTQTNVALHECVTDSEEWQYCGQMQRWLSLCKDYRRALCFLVIWLMQVWECGGMWNIINSDTVFWPVRIRENLQETISFYCSKSSHLIELRSSENHFFWPNCDLAWHFTWKLANQPENYKQFASILPNYDNRSAPQ